MKSEQMEEAEIKQLMKSLPVYDPLLFVPSVKAGDKYAFRNGTETIALCDSYLNCDNMECCRWQGFGYWLVCHMTKVKE